MVLFIAILMILIFSIAWFCVWFWFFRIDQKTLLKMADLGRKAFTKGHYKKAKELFQKIVKRESGFDVKYKLGISQMKLGEFKGAKLCFEEILKKEPKNVDALIKLAAIYLEEKNYEKAFDYYKQVLTFQHNNLESILGIAMIYFENMDFKNALDVFERAKDLSPDDEKISIAILKCRSELCDMDDKVEITKILDDYMKIGRVAENIPEYHVAVAKTFAKTGNINDALAHCERSIELNPKDIEARQLLGLIQLIKQDFEGAKDTLNMALSYNPNDKETHNILSYVVCQQIDDCPLQKCRKEYYNLIKDYLK